MPSNWDQPEPISAAPISSESGGPRRAGWRRKTAETPAPVQDGLIQPQVLTRFVGRNWLAIAAAALLAGAAGVALLSVVPFPYRATATVLVDPRSQQVTLQENVLQPIGADAAVLESMVQIMKSDGFLLPVMQRIGLPGGQGASEEQRLRQLADFKKNLSVERKGATYLVEVSFKAASAQEAARMANAVATTFADTQNGYLSEATQNAARALSQRLVELRRKLDASEKAVADFAAQRGLVYVDGGSTLQRRQLAELSAQLAAARTATEEARARYQQQLDASNSSVVLSDGRNGEPAQLAFLRQQRAQLMQTLEEQNLTYGPRHPRIAATRRAIEGVDRQIGSERALLVNQLRGALDVAAAQQKKLEADISGLSSGVAMTESDEVRLEALRREAAADRNIYESFLSRNKATDELAELKNDNVRVVSPAVPPLRSSKPSTALVAPLLALLGAAAATIGLALRQGLTSPRRREVEEDAEPAQPAVDAAPAVTPAPETPAVPMAANTQAIDETPAQAVPPAPARDNEAAPRRHPASTSLLMLAKSLKEEAQRESVDIAPASRSIS
ncbi:MAG: GumC family protein [Rhizobiaceae bacterium]